MGSQVTAIVYPNKQSVPNFGNVKSSERTTLSLKQRQDLLLQKAEKPFNVSQKKYEIQQKMEMIIDQPSQMKIFQDVVRNIKTAKRKNLSGVMENNKYMAKNWDIFEKVKNQRLSKCIQDNTQAVIRKKKKIERLTRRKRIEYQQFWIKKREEVRIHMFMN